MKKVIYFLLFFLFCVLTIVIINTPIGTFDKLVLSNYTQKDEEIMFDEVMISKDIYDREPIRYDSDDAEAINQLLDIFKNYKLIQYNKNLPIHAYDINNSYSIYFKNSHTYEEMHIHVVSNKFIKISTLIYSNNEEKRIIALDRKEKRYKVVGEGIDIDLLEELVESLNRMKN